MMKIETDSEEESAGGRSNIQSKYWMEMKLLIEQMREQIQNLG